MIKKSIIYIFSFFCTTVMCLSYAVATSCTTTADCLYNQYCKIGGMDGGTCSYCTKPDNSDWDPNGTRNGDGETSCPWKCNTGYTGQECNVCATNYYQHDDSKCYECPYKSTTVSGNTTDCFWTTNSAIADKNHPHTGAFVDTNNLPHKIVPVSDAVKQQARTNNNP